MYLRSEYTLYNLESMQRVCAGVYNGTPCIFGIESDGTYRPLQGYASGEEAVGVFEALCDAIEGGAVLFDLTGGSV